MSNSSRDQLLRATVLTFEGLGFMLPSSDLDPEQAAARTDVSVEIAFRGPVRGRLVLSVAGGILPAIVANMLGDENGRDPRAQADALGELANVICGNVLPGVAGEERTFALEAPRPVESRDPHGGHPAARIRVGIDSGRADVSLHLEALPEGTREAA